MLSITKQIEKRGKMLEELRFLGIKILITLGSSAEKKMYIRELIREAEISSSAIYRALAQLQDYGLISYEYIFNRKYVVLTSYGVKVAEHLVEADRLIEEARNRKKKALGNP